MILRVLVFGMVLGVVGWGGVSCTENEPPPARSKPVTILSPPVSSKPPGAQSMSESRDRRAEARQQQQQRQQQPISASVVPQVPPGAPAPPKGAQYTIFCGRVTGEAHVQRANRVKEQLIATSGLNGFYVVHEDQQSILYYGFYRTFNDPNDRKEAARAQADLRRIKMLESDGNRLFAGALFVDLEAPDPQAPPEWNLTNARGVWSLQIAAYKDSPLRKEAAVDAVREARKQGIEAYYYHGDSVSSVCIGAWPEGAVRVMDASQAKVRPYEDVLVTPPGVEATGLTRQRQDVKVVNEKVEILDPALMATMKQYPHHAINGVHMVKRVNGQEIIDPSLLIRIPEAQAADSIFTSAPPKPQPQQQLQPMSSSSFGDLEQPPAPDQTERPVTRKRPASPPPQQPGLGKLKSIDG